MRKFWMVGIVLALLVGMSAVRAEENTPQPGTPEDNECNPGGVLYREENQDGCPSLWYWKAGWFLARFNRGLISRADFPKEFESVLPPLTDTRIQTICGTMMDEGDKWFGCVHSDGTGYETVDELFYSYLVFTSDPATCPLTFNGLKLVFPVSTQDYMIDFYLFSAEQVASVGGIAPVTCVYTPSR